MNEAAKMVDADLMCSGYRAFLGFYKVKILFLGRTGGGSTRRAKGRKRKEWIQVPAVLEEKRRRDRGGSHADVLLAR